MFVPQKDKECHLVSLLNNNLESTVIVFVSSCVKTIKFANLLRELGLSAISLNGKMDQSNRLAALNKFKAGERTILVATDVASRGLDIPSVDMVVNYDIPENPKDYVHRVGRTARAGRSGVSVAMVDQYEVKQYTTIEEHIQLKLPELKFDERAVNALKPRVMDALRTVTNVMN